MPTLIKTLRRPARLTTTLYRLSRLNPDVARTSPDVAPTRADFNNNITLNGFFSLQYQNDTQESKRFQAKYQEIIIMPFIYVYGRQVGIGRGSVGIGRGSVGIGRSQVGTDRYKSGLRRG